jgi:hypothetical protein
MATRASFLGKLAAALAAPILGRAGIPAGTGLGTTPAVGAAGVVKGGQLMARGYAAPLRAVGTMGATQLADIHEAVALATAQESDNEGDGAMTKRIREDATTSEEPVDIPDAAVGWHSEAEVLDLDMAAAGAYGAAATGQRGPISITEEAGEEEQRGTRRPSQPDPRTIRCPQSDNARHIWREAGHVDSRHMRLYCPACGVVISVKSVEVE